MTKRLLALVFVTVGMLGLAAAPAQAATPPPSPPWEQVGPGYWRPGDCGFAGWTGQQNGQWQQYQCVRLGLGEPWDLWVLR